MVWLTLLGIGLGAGVMSGMFGIGGGLIIVPALLWLLKFPMHIASATSLVALMLPIGVMLAVYQYYAEGRLTNQHLIYGGMICIGMALGAFFGARLALSIDQTTLRKSFAVFLIFAAVLTWFKK